MERKDTKDAVKENRKGKNRRRKDKRWNRRDKKRELCKWKKERGKSLIDKARIWKDKDKDRLKERRKGEILGRKISDGRGETGKRELCK